MKVAIVKSSAQADRCALEKLGTGRRRLQIAGANPRAGLSSSEPGALFSEKYGSVQK